MNRPLLLALLAAAATDCDPIPDLYVVDGSLDTRVTGTDAPDSDDGNAGDAATDGGGDEGPAICTGVSCPGCPPNPGACCANGVPCFGYDCTVDCAMCATCAGYCCSKQGGPPLCKSGDSGKCP